MWKKIYIILIVLITFFPKIGYTEEVSFEQQIKSRIQKDYNLDFFEKDVIILDNIPLKKELIIKGYSYKKGNDNLSIKAAKSDLLKSYAAFIKGLNYELNDNKLKLVFDDNIKIKNIEIKDLTNSIYEASSNLNLSDKFISVYSKKNSIFVYSITEIKDDILVAFSEAKNKALIKGLNEFYINKKQDNIKGKIFFQETIYNSLDEYNPFQTEVIFILRFIILEN